MAPSTKAPLSAPPAGRSPDPPRSLQCSPRACLGAAAIILAAAFVYLPAIRGSWLWDDDTEILSNPLLRDASGLRKIWLSTAGPDYFPLKSTLHWAEWHLWGDRVLGYHLTSVALHVASALLLWKILAKLGARGAWLGGLLLVVHPLAVESVAWMAELKNALSLPPLLLAFDSHLEHERTGRRCHGIRSVAWFLAAMLCKSSVVMLPVVLLLYAQWRRGRVAVRDLLTAAPYVAISAALGSVTLWFQFHRAIAGWAIPLGSWAERAASAGAAVVFYLRKCALPFELSPIYPAWHARAGTPSAWLPLVAVGAGVAWLWAARAPWARHARLGFGFFLVNLVPILGFAPMAYLRISPVADHFAYVPLVGIVGLAAALGGAALARRPAAAAAAIAALCALLAVRSRTYDRLFSDSERLWAHAIRATPAAPLAHNNLGNALLDRGRIDEALAEYQAALRIDPNYAEAHNNIGNLLAEQGRLDDARREFEAALRIFPDYATANNGLGVVEMRSGKIEEAIRRLERAIHFHPMYPEAHANLGRAFSKAGRSADAIREFEEAVRLNPALTDAREDLANALCAEGRMTEALAQYESAVRLRPGSAVGEYNWGVALTRAGRLQEAVRHYSSAVRLDPALIPAHRNLGLALERLGRTDEGAAHLAEADRLEAAPHGGSSPPP